MFVFGLADMVVTMTMPTFMVMFTATSGLVLKPHAQHIEQKQDKDARTKPLEPPCHIVTTSKGVAQMFGKPLARQEVVDDKAEKDGTTNDGSEVENERPLAQYLVDDKNGSYVTSRACHEHDEGCTWC